MNWRGWRLFHESAFIVLHHKCHTETIVQSLEYTLAVLADLREELERMRAKGASQHARTLTFTTVADAILSLAPDTERDWVVGRLEELRSEFDVEAQLSIQSW